MKEYLTNEELDRFMDKFEIVDGCYLWQGKLDKDGYGMFYFRKKNRRAHRVGYFSKKGPIEKGLVIGHSCRNRSCVKPEHLQAITARQNALENSESVAAKNAAKTKCKYGHLFDKLYGKQRYCSICEIAKRNRLAKKWKAEADAVGC